MKDILEHLRAIVQKAEDINLRSADVMDVDDVALIDEYLEDLNTWRENYSKINSSRISPELKESLQSEIILLESKHQAILNKAQEVIGQIKSEMGKINKTAQALKKYIDSPGLQSKVLRKKG